MDMESSILICYYFVKEVLKARDQKWFLLYFCGPAQVYLVPLSFALYPLFLPGTTSIYVMPLVVTWYHLYLLDIICFYPVSFVLPSTTRIYLVPLFFT